jgi:hypothetical protein
MNNTIDDGTHTFIVNSVSINVEVYNFTSDVTYATTPTLGSATTDSVMLVLIYHSNLTINSGVTITPQVRKKGMFIYCAGTLTNNGSISMTARGASSAGQNIYLWQNSDSTFEYIPANGAVGGTYVTSYANGSYVGVAGNIGKAGSTSSKRSTGGGGSGAAGTWRPSGTPGRVYSGSGGNGTSFSGGTGGGGIRIDISNTATYGPLGAGSSTGGTGGAGYAIQGNSTPVITAGGGAGNPGSNGGTSSSGGAIGNGNTTTYKGGTGTGGLLIIYCKNIINSGSIVSNGSAGGGSGNDGAGGGGSGGGSINIFYSSTYTSTGTMSANGGAAGYGNYSTMGAAGGAGTINSTRIGFPSIFSGNLLSNSVHTEDAILTGSITDTNTPLSKVQYKILLNDVQIYPSSGYTDLANQPVSINYTIPNSLLTNLNNKITININNDLNLPSTYTFYTTVYNNVPSGNLNLSQITVNSESVNLTGTLVDSDLDNISYRILLNNVEVLSWSQFTEDPYIDYIFKNSDLIIGANKINVEYKDDFKNVGLGSWTNTINKFDNPPTINIQYINGSIIGTITDPDSNLVQYKIFINGIQTYPVDGYTDLEQVANINYQINRNDILINENNIIKVYAQDEIGATITQEISFIGEYVGLMFMDENQQFYTTDIGELLQYLDFGIITLGQITEPVKVLVQNKYGFSIKDINLIVSNNLSNISIELSKEENPFIATDNLILEDTYKPNEIDYFYIRLNTSISPNSISGTFKIHAKATSLS